MELVGPCPSSSYPYFTEPLGVRFYEIVKVRKNETLQFPGEKSDEDIVLNFGRGKAEALWRLGIISESEAAFAALVERLPDAGWAYIGWADEYWIFNDSSKDYARGETILKQALQHPNLQDRSDVLERLKDLYLEWGKNAEAESIARQLNNLSSKPAKSSHRHKKKKH